MRRIRILLPMPIDLSANISIAICQAELVTIFLKRRHKTLLGLLSMLIDLDGFDASDGYREVGFSSSGCLAPPVR